MKAESLPLCLVVGFLGSGKTTFLKQITRQYAHQKLAFVVNEFSAVDADGAALKREHDKVVCLPGGSVFCRCLAGQFLQTLRDLPEILSLEQCDGVVVEASGIADPGVAPQMLREAELEFRYYISRIVALVDPGNIAHLLDKFPNTRSQLVAADIILINKADVYDKNVIEAAVALSKSVNPKAAVERTIHSEIALDLFGAGSGSTPSGAYATVPDPNFARCTARTEVPVDVARLLRAINSMGGELYRAKGFLMDAGGAVYLDWTPSTCSQFEFPGHADPCVFSFIGKGEKTPAINALAARLQAGAFSAKDAR